MGKRYGFLRVAGIVFKIVAIAVVVVGGVSGFGIMVARELPPNTTRSMGIVLILAATLQFLLLFSLGELIKVVLAIEENTRKA
jgi:predicted small integral membrane protein